LPSKGNERAFFKEMTNTTYPYEVVKIISSDNTITYTLPIGDGKSFKKILKSQVLNKVKKDDETCVEPNFSAILMTNNNEGESSELVNFEFFGSDGTGSWYGVGTAVESGISTAGRINTNFIGPGNTILTLNSG